MKKIIVSLFVALAMAGCANQPQQTPAQVAARVCPAATDTLASLQKLQGLPAQDAATLAKVAPLVDAACAAASVTSDNIRDLSVQVFPALTDIVSASPLDETDKNAAIFDLGAAQIIVDNVVAAMPPTVTTAPTASAVTPAAPAAK